MTAIKKETCEEQLRRMCRSIAMDITDGLKIDDTSGQGTVSEWMEGVYDIRYLVDREKKYLGAQLMVAGGGPSILLPDNLITKFSGTASGAGR